MRLLDEQYTRTPFYGTRKMTAWLQTQGYAVNRKRVLRLLRQMGLEAIYPKPRLSLPGRTQQRYPYLLRGTSITRCNQVWSCDITYIRLQRGFIYLMAIMDWFSRYVLAWEVSITLDTSFCLEALDRALQLATPEMFNSEEASAIYQHRVYEPAQSGSYSYQLGWPRTGLRQCVCGALMAQCKIRGGVSQRLSRRFRCREQLASVLHVLQSRASSSSVRVSNASGSVYREGTEGSSKLSCISFQT
jgi:transposase InsO family protein